MRPQERADVMVLRNDHQPSVNPLTNIPGSFETRKHIRRTCRPSLSTTHRQLQEIMINKMMRRLHTMNLLPLQTNGKSL